MAPHSLVPTSHLLWLALSSLVILYEDMFLLLRPDSLKQGHLHAYFQSFDHYIQIDPLFADLDDWFVVVLVVFNSAEMFLNAAGAVLCQGSRTVRGRNAGAMVLLAASCFSLWKTLMFLAYDFPHFQWQDGNGWNVLWLYVVPNVCWVVFPALGIARIAWNMLLRMERQEGNGDGQAERDKARKEARGVREDSRTGPQKEKAQ